MFKNTLICAYASDYEIGKILMNISSRYESWDLISMCCHQNLDLIHVNDYIIGDAIQTILKLHFFGT